MRGNDNLRQLFFDDNRDNWRGNQYPCRAQGINKINNLNNLIQQHSARNNTASGRGDEREV